MKEYIYRKVKNKFWKEKILKYELIMGFFGW